MSRFAKELLEWHKSNCRYCLQDVDVQFIKYILKGAGYTESDWKLLNEDMEFKNMILDNELLSNAILEHPSNIPISLELYFYVLVRKSLKKHNLASRKLADYLVSMLVQRARSGTGSGVLYLTDELQKIATEESEENRFFMQVRLGNQTLFVTSLLEDHLKARFDRKGAPNLDFYQMIGQGQYWEAHQHPMADEFRLKEVLGVLGESFGEVRLALNQFGSRLTSFGDPFL